MAAALGISDRTARLHLDHFIAWTGCSGGKRRRRWRGHARILPGLPRRGGVDLQDRVSLEELGEEEAMRSLKRLAAGLAAALTLGAAAPGAEWQALSDEAIALYRQGQYAKALESANKALKIATRDAPTAWLVAGWSLDNVAVQCRALGRYAEAEPLYARCLAIREKVLGPDHPEVAAALDNVAMLLDAQGRYEQAEPLYRRALAIPREGPGPGAPRGGREPEQPGRDVFSRAQV